jgi:hypothetical protein
MTEATADKSVVDRLAELERRVLGAEKPPAEPEVPLSLCNAKSREVAHEDKKKKMSAATLAKAAIDKAFNPTERESKAGAKTQKPASAVSAELAAKSAAKPA